MSPKPPPLAPVDNHLRSFAKAVSWRVTGTLDTILVSFIITGRIKLALSIGCLELATKTLLYYLHERVWNRVSFGKVHARPDYEI
ncbi:MAG TPA: DUF2061 domain-containing protein [Candidatus Paceibacterota bacterium]|nr:DUF2061 domain-containing protein [Verrucomicrobiota bacterium]HSA11448.1 DUF2061 domain-containing protein [Candidatus Paceibacterota bacterium]